jgi:hypothetical protein
MQELKRTLFNIRCLMFDTFDIGTFVNLLNIEQGTLNKE